MQRNHTEPVAPFTHCDQALARRLERAEGRAGVDFVRARAKAFPQVGGQVIEVAGAYAMYDGVGSPCTQTFGLGLFQTVTTADMARLEQFFQLGQVNAHRQNTCCFLAEKQGEAIAAAALYVFEGVALLAGACTVPEWRRQGAQLALLEHRLRYGAEQGCDIGMVVAQQPGSASQRNAERQGFRLAYTRIKWRLGP
jgi:hypothetical protein